MINTQVSVLIPTFRRLEALEACLRSVFAQGGLRPHEIEVVVCDNSPEASARAHVDQLAPLCPFNLTFVHEPRPGAANARNALVKAASGVWLASIDDDEIAPEGWLSALLAGQAATGADVVFGPVVGQAPESCGPHRAYFEAFFSRRMPQAPKDRPTQIDCYFGCGNSLVRRAALPSNAPFDPAQNDQGGEDDKLFQALRLCGARMAWVPDAWLFEAAPPARCTLRYTIRRAFAYGQGPSEAAVSLKPVAYANLAVLMLKGAVQAAAFGVIAAAAFAVRLPGRAHCLDLAARGLGKLLWFRPFKQEFYGRALLRMKACTSAPAFTPSDKSASTV